LRSAHSNPPRRDHQPQSTTHFTVKLFHENGLSIVLLAMFFFSLLGQVITGHRVHNNEALEHGRSPIGFRQYVSTGHCLEAVFENWESEFLQMTIFVVLTVKLR